MPSILTKSQKKEYRKDYFSNGKPETIIATVRYDDECGNGHNTFAITASIYTTYRYPGEQAIKHKSGKILWLSSCGCQHEEVAKYFPELAPFIKWHLMNSDGPCYYIENSMYWLYPSKYKSEYSSNPPNKQHFKSTCIFGIKPYDGLTFFFTFNIKIFVRFWLKNRLSFVIEKHSMTN
jgi:hypothetical protein